MKSEKTECNIISAPAYMSLYRSGELHRRVVAAASILGHCELCPHRCRVNRIAGEKGRCRSGANPIVSSHNAHFGEEPPLVGEGGSGTIFFTNCTLRCVFCQNYPISQLGVGNEYSVSQLTDMFIYLQRRGCENINFVTPTHFVPQILQALEFAVSRGFSLPLVYNTSGYERVEILRLLDGIFDIYLPDIKYSDDDMALKYSGAENYVKHSRAALKEMFRQVGVLRCDERGVAQRGLIVRHLVLPGGIAGTQESLHWLAKEVSPKIHLALMSQYFPAYRAPEMPEISRRVKADEYRPLARLHEELGFAGWIQPSHQGGRVFAEDRQTD